MDEDALRERVETWSRRAVEALNPEERAANRLIADHYAALADRTSGRPAARQIEDR